MSEMANSPAPQSAAKIEIRGIVRILGRDLKGQLPISAALKKVRGVGHNMSVSLAKVMMNEMGIDPKTQVGALSDAQIEEIEALIKSPSSHGIQGYLLNRNRDEDDGTNKHVAQSDLEFAVRQDHESDRISRSYVGWRLSMGQRVHGQHNRTTGRSGMTVGVLKKALKAQKEASKGGAAGGKAAAPAAKEAKK